MIDCLFDSRSNKIFSSRINEKKSRHVYMVRATPIYDECIDEPAALVDIDRKKVMTKEIMYSLKKTKSKERKEKMAKELIAERNDDCEVNDPPRGPRAEGEKDHGCHNGETDNVHPHEVLDDFDDAQSETSLFHFFGCRRPLHVDAEEMTQ